MGNLELLSVASLGSLRQPVFKSKDCHFPSHQQRDETQGHVQTEHGAQAMVLEALHYRIGRLHKDYPTTQQTETDYQLSNWSQWTQ